MKSGIRVLVVYAINPDSLKATTWSDGFVAAMGLLNDVYEISWFNCYGRPGGRSFRDAARKCDLVLANSNWGWIVDRYVRRHLWSSRPRRAINVQGVRDVTGREMSYYDVIYYQTEWYRRRLPQSPRLVHAFGTNTMVMYAPPEPQLSLWDWLFVGSILPYKRPLLLLEKPGRRLAVGEFDQSDPDLIAQLRAGGVEVRPYVALEELRELYWSAQRTYVPCTLDGGGERAVLEARACGCEVVIEEDNPKLREVMERSGAWDERYYANQLGKGIEMAFDSHPQRFARFGKRFFSRV